MKKMLLCLSLCLSFLAPPSSQACEGDRDPTGLYSSSQGKVRINVPVKDLILKSQIKATVNLLSGGSLNADYYNNVECVSTYGRLSKGKLISMVDAGAQENLDTGMGLLLRALVQGMGYSDDRDNIYIWAQREAFVLDEPFTGYGKWPMGPLYELLTRKYDFSESSTRLSEVDIEKSLLVDHPLTCYYRYVQLSITANHLRTVLAKLQPKPTPQATPATSAPTTSVMVHQIKNKS